MYVSPMTVAAASVFFVLPLGLAFWRDKRPPRFPFDRFFGREDRRRTAPILALAVLIVPGSLVLMASGLVSAQWLFFVFSTLGVLAGVYTLLGLWALPLAALPVSASWFFDGDLGLLAFNVCALLAALGAGELLASLLRGRELVFVAALAAVDVVVVALGLPQDVVVPALLGPAPAVAEVPPIYAGVALDGVFLGGIDLALAWLVGGYLRRTRLAADVRALSVFAVFQAGMIVSGLISGVGLPATIPPLMALLAGRASPRRRRRLLRRLTLRGGPDRLCVGERASGP